MALALPPPPPCLRKLQPEPRPLQERPPQERRLLEVLAPEADLAGDKDAAGPEIFSR